MSRRVRIPFDDSYFGISLFGEVSIYNPSSTTCYQLYQSAVERWDKDRTR